MSDQDSQVMTNARIVEDLIGCARCCKFCREQTSIDRLMQIEPAEAPLQPAILLHTPNNIMERKP
jgi:hypothetical protein